MLEFPINPEYCLILNAFSRAKTLRGAAALLDMDPPSLVRKVRRLSLEHDYLHKVANRWVLNEAGRRIAQWTDGVINEQKLLKEDRGRTRIGAFTWLAEEMLIPQFKLLDQKLQIDQSWSFHIVAKELEQELLQSRVDFIVAGHVPNDPAVAHKKISVYPWIVVVPKAWKKRFDHKSSLENVALLSDLPFVRHAEVNPERYLEWKPKRYFNCSFDGVIGIRSAVAAGYGWSIVPAMSAQSLLLGGEILKLDLSLKIKDEVSLWWLRDRKDLSADAKIISQWIGCLKVI